MAPDDHDIDLDVALEDLSDEPELGDPLDRDPSLWVPMWIDLAPPHEVACHAHRDRLTRPALVTEGEKDLRRLAHRLEQSNVCEVHDG